MLAALMFRDLLDRSLFHYAIFFFVSYYSFFNFYFFLLLFKYGCLHFPTYTLLCPTHPYLPPSILPPFGFVHGSFIHFPWWPFSFFPPYTPPLLLCLFYMHMYRGPHDSGFYVLFSIVSYYLKLYYHYFNFITSLDTYFYKFSNMLFPSIFSCLLLSF